MRSTLASGRLLRKFFQNLRYGHKRPKVSQKLSACASSGTLARGQRTSELGHRYDEDGDGLEVPAGNERDAWVTCSGEPASRRAATGHRSKRARRPRLARTRCRCDTNIRCGTTSEEVDHARTRKEVLNPARAARNGDGDVARIAAWQGVGERRTNGLSAAQRLRR